MIRDTIQAYKNKKPNSPEGRIVQRMDHLRDQLQNAFAIGLSEGGHNYQRGGKVNTTQMSGTKLSATKSRWFEKDKYFEKRVDQWAELSHGSYVKVGKLSENSPVVMVGMPAGVISYDVSKIRKNMADHNDYLNEDLLRRLPEIIADPIAISKYSDDTISVFGDVFVRKHPMMVGIVISRDRAGNSISKVRTYNLRSDANNLLTNDKVLYLNEDKKRTLKWFQACGIQVPLGGTKFGFINSIHNAPKKVNKKSVRYQINAAAREHLQAATGDMGADVDALKQLVSMLNKQTGMNRLKHGTLDAAASFLMRTAGARGDKQQLMRMLHEFYSYVGQTEGLSWEAIQQEARPIAEWLTDHMVRTKQMSEYAAEVLDTVRHSRIYLDDAQRKEVEYAFGSYGAYRSAMMGSVVLANDRSISLDTQWQEWAGMYPDVFDEDMNATDMPGELMNIVQRMRNSDTSELEFEYNRDFIIQDLTNRVYDS